MGDLAGGGGAGGDEAVEDGAVIIGEENVMQFLAHDAPPAGWDAAPIGGHPNLTIGCAML